MAKKKKEKRGKGLINFLFSLLMTGLIGYLGIVVYQSFLLKIEMTEKLMDFEKNIKWFEKQDEYVQYPIFAVMAFAFVIMLLMTKQKTSGYTDASSHGVYGNAVFSDLEELKKEGFTPPHIGFPKKSQSRWSTDPFKTLKASEGIILGREDKDLVIIHPESKLDNRNVLVVGSPGSSKGQAFVIPNLLNNYTSSMIVTDPKGELYDQLADIKRDQGYDVHQVDFMNLVGSRYNPLDYIDSDLDARNVATTISRNSAKDIKEDFFFNTARDLLVGLILLAKADRQGGLTTKASMNKVKSLFNDISANERLLLEICDSIGSDHVAYQYLKEASVAEGNTRASILSSFAQQTGTFSLKPVMDFTSESDFNFQDLQDRKTIMFVKIPIVSNSVSALTATFFDQLFTKLYKIGDQHKSILPIPTICILDEFANLGKLNDYDNILSTCRGYRLSLITIIQDFAQLDEKYSKEQRRTFVNNHDTALFLRTKDEETAKYFEESAGDTTVRYTTKSKSASGSLAYILDIGGSGGGGSSPSESEQYQKKPLVSKSDLLNMKGDTCYIFTAGRVLELEKAFQSVIYKGFITSTKKENGRFAYVYPTHRQKYIDQMGFVPFEKASKDNHASLEVATSRVEEKEHIAKSEKPRTFEDSVQVESPSLTKTESKIEPSTDDSMATYAKEMFNEVFKDLEKIVETPFNSVEDNEPPKTLEKEGKPLTSDERAEKQANVLRDAYMIQESDPDTAREMANLFSGRNLVSEIAKTNEMSNKLDELDESKNILGSLSAKMMQTNDELDEEENTSDEIIENDEDLLGF